MGESASLLLFYNLIYRMIIQQIFPVVNRYLKKFRYFLLFIDFCFKIYVILNLVALNILVAEICKLAVFFIASHHFTDEKRHYKSHDYREIEG